MKITFEDLEKQCKACAEEFMEELELLPIFLNYYPDVQEQWLYELGLTTTDTMKIRKVIDEYARKKVELENKEKPQKREEVIKIEDKVLREMYEGKVLRLEHVKGEFIFAYMRSKYPDAVILDKNQLEKLEQLTLFKDHQRRFPVNYLIFDAEKNKIVGYEVIKK